MLHASHCNADQWARFVQVLCTRGGGGDGQVKLAGSTGTVLRGLPNCVWCFIDCSRWPTTIDRMDMNESNA